MAAAIVEEKKAKVDQEVITAVYKVNLHCLQCARDIKKPLMRTEGVHNVEFDTQKGEIKVKGAIDVIKTQKLIEKYSQKKVELVSPQIKIKETVATEKKVVKEIKEPILHTTTAKVHLHCEKCESDLKKKLLKHPGIHSVKSDIKAQTLVVQGTIEPDTLIGYLRKKVHKNAEIVSSKKEEKKVEKKVEKEEKKVEKKIEEKAKVEEKLAGTKEIVEYMVEKKVEAKTKEGNVPYFVHYVYAPQMFSDENPNACYVM